MLADVSGTHNSRRCSSMQKCFYGLGHIYNDLCAAMWFSYTLFYFQIVLQMDSKTAGILLMLGTLAVSIGFTLIFSIKPATFTSWVLVYYAGVITLFQVGWAIVQISHLSILPEISMNHSSSSDLTAIRYTASVCCSISIYVITLIILKNGNDQNNIGPEDFYKFKEIALLITFIGLISCSLFYCGMLSKPDYEEIVEDDPQDDANELSTKGKITHFLKSSITYQVSLMYMASRLFTTLNLIYIPLYLEERDVNTESTDDGIRQTIATVPLVSYLSSFLMAIILKYRPKGCNDKIAYLTGAIISLIGSLWIGVGVFSSSHIEIYFIASLIGIGGSSTMVSSLCLTANFVKTNGYGGGSVYSMVTFTDKLISGMVVLIVQNVQCTPKKLCPNFYQHVLGFLGMGVIIIGLLSLISLHWKVGRNGGSM